MSSREVATALYERARRSEGRMLTDEVVSGLPASGTNTPHPDEWRIRQRTLDRVSRMLQHRAHDVLEIGCGNGWFSARLAERGHSVTAVDTGETELTQARRVFAHLAITWVSGDPWSDALQARSFDVILFAASFQYFPDPRSLLARCRELCREGGEAIIADSPFYADEHKAAAARERSRAYYASIGVADMAAHYHHHTRSSLLEATAMAQVRYSPPRSRPVALLMGRYPFPIVRIRW